MFIAPTWFEGLLFWLIFLIPITLGIGLIFINKKNSKVLSVLSIVLIIIGVICLIASPVLWFYTYEVPSVSEKTVTVASWQPKPGLEVNDKGVMVIDSADDLMMITSTCEGFKNDENLFFGKFDTRDILNKAKPGSVVKVKYYGWREGFNNGFPNILSIDVVDDSNADNKTVNDYFGTKVV